MKHSGRAQGFTLIELLVVIAIIAIVTASVLLSINIVGDDREARTEARRLASLVEVALDEALMQGRDFGLELSSGGYRFVEYDPLTLSWAEVFGDDTLRLRTLPDGVSLQLFMEDKRVPLDDKFEEIEESDAGSVNANAYAPHLLIFSSGDLTPFELHIARDQMEQPIVVTGDLLGKLEITTGEEL
jgi:general secretion pathway protein H